MIVNDILEGHKNKRSKLISKIISRGTEETRGHPQSGYPVVAVGTEDGTYRIKAEMLRLNRNILILCNSKRFFEPEKFVTSYHIQISL
jgi:hypothetical protein